MIRLINDKNGAIWELTDVILVINVINIVINYEFFISYYNEQMNSWR